MRASKSAAGMDSETEAPLERLAARACRLENIDSNGREKPKTGGANQVPTVGDEVDDEAGTNVRVGGDADVAHTGATRGGVEAGLFDGGDYDFATERISGVR